MKAKALDSFATSELGMVHAGSVIDVSQVSMSRLEEWWKRGLIGPYREEPELDQTPVGEDPDKLSTDMSSDLPPEATEATEATEAVVAEEPDAVKADVELIQNKMEVAPKNKGKRNADQG